MCNLSEGIYDRGFANGERNTTYKYVQNGRISLEEAASDLGVSVEKLKEDMVAAGFTYPGLKQS